MWYISFPCMCAQLLSCVRLFVTPWTTALQAPLSVGFSSQMLEWVAIFSSRGSSWPRDQICISCVSCVGRWNLYHWGIWEDLFSLSLHKYKTTLNLPVAFSYCSWGSHGQNTGVGCHFLLQGIFPTQGSNLHLLCLLHWQVEYLLLVPPILFNVWGGANWKKKLDKSCYKLEFSTRMVMEGNFSILYNTNCSYS